MRRRFGSVLLLVMLALLDIARAQGDASKTTGDENVEINLDALNEPEPLVPEMLVPEIKTLPPEGPVMPRRKPVAVVQTSGKSVPLPRLKPGSEPLTARAVEVKTEPPPALVKPSKRSPVVLGKAPAKPEVPVNIVENFPVEISGVAADPFAGNKAHNPIAGFSVISRVQFSKDDSHLLSAAFGTLDALAVKLASTSERVRLAGFSGKTGDMSSQARRLSLERARAVRDYLVSKGIPFDRMDILPFGGAKDGVADRVDVLAFGS